MKDSIFIVIVVAILAIVGIAVYQSGHATATASPTGSTFSTARIAAVTMAPADTTSSSTAILNTDTSDRYVESTFADCTGVGTSKGYLAGVGLANLVMNIATSSAASQTGSLNYLATLNVATSSVSTNATSTLPVLGSLALLWPSGTYINLTFNATNTAVCTVGVHYLPS